MSNPFKDDTGKPIPQFKQEAEVWDGLKKSLPDFFRKATQREKWVLFERIYWGAK